MDKNSDWHQEELEDLLKRFEFELKIVDFEKKLNDLMEDDE